MSSPTSPLPGVTWHQRVFAQVSTLTENPDKAVKTIGLLGIVLYIVGLVTVNSYLFHYDISNFDLVKAKYVVTGAFVVIVFCLTFLLSIYPAMCLVRDRPKLLERLPLIVSVPLLYALFICIGWTLWLAIFSVLAFANLSGNWLARVPMVARYPHAIAIAARDLLAPEVFLGILAELWLLSMPRRRSTTWRTTLAHRGCMLIAAGALVPGVYWFCGSFAVNAFPLVAEEAGGGRPEFARLLFAQDIGNGVRELRINLDSDQRLSKSVLVLYRSNDSYVFLNLTQDSRDQTLFCPDTTTTIQFDKKLVTGVVFIRYATEVTHGVLDPPCLQPKPSP